MKPEEVAIRCQNQGVGWRQCGIGVCKGAGVKMTHLAKFSTACGGQWPKG